VSRTEGKAGRIFVFSLDTLYSTLLSFPRHLPLVTCHFFSLLFTDYLLPLLIDYWLLMTLSSEVRRANFISGTTAGARVRTVIFFSEKKKSLSCLSRDEVLCLKNKSLIESMNDSTHCGGI